jgi:hypothetical protein
MICLQVFIWVLMIARWRGLGFPEEDMPLAEGSLMPKEVRLTARIAIKNMISFLFNSLLYKTDLSPEFGLMTCC